MGFRQEEEYNANLESIGNGKYGFPDIWMNTQI